MERVCTLRDKIGTLWAQKSGSGGTEGFFIKKGAKGDLIHEKTMNKERKREFKLSKINRFTQRTRYFTDSGIIGTREFVSKNYQQFKHIFQSKNEKIPKRIKGLGDVYSLKRLSEA